MKEVITSVSNSIIKNIVKLSGKSSERKSQNLIVIEGAREINLAKENGFEIEILFVCSEIIKQNFFEFNSVVEVSKNVFKKIAYRENSDGLIALAKPKFLKLSELRFSANPFIIILESVEKPGNLGAILRTADAAGADAVIICDAKTDLYNPNVIRSSIGCVFTNQIVVSFSDAVLQFLREKKIKIFAAALSAKKNYTEVDLTLPSAIAMGTEAHGLTAKWLAAAGEQIKIPMLGKIDSLNVSTSCAILAFEAVRQRRQCQMPVHPNRYA